jgi:hypothetical protein
MLQAVGGSNVAGTTARYEGSGDVLSIGIIELPQFTIEVAWHPSAFQVTDCDLLGDFNGASPLAINRKRHSTRSQAGVSEPINESGRASGGPCSKNSTLDQQAVIELRHNVIPFVFDRPWPRSGKNGLPNGRIPQAVLLRDADFA